MKCLFAIVCILLGSQFTFAKTLTFDQWKKREIYRARLQLQRQQGQKPIQVGDTSKSNLPRGVIGSQRVFAAPVSDRSRVELRKMAKEDRRKNQELWRLEAAQNLVIRDYLEVYLRSRPNFYEAMRDIAKEMSTEEMTQLLLEYGNVSESYL